MSQTSAGLGKAVTGVNVANTGSAGQALAAVTGNAAKCWWRFGCSRWWTGGAQPAGGVKDAGAASQLTPLKRLAATDAGSGAAKNRRLTPRLLEMQELRQTQVLEPQVLQVVQVPPQEDQPHLE